MSEQNSDPSRPFDPPVPPTSPPTAPPAAPAAPPAPPTPPAPERPAVPQYGEYAPAGYVAPGMPAAPAAPANPYGVPAYGAPAAAPAGLAPAYAPLPKRRRTWDVVLTSILLVLALIGTIIALGYAAAFSDPDLLNSALAQQGLSGDLHPGAAPLIIVVSHLVLFVLAVGLSIPLLVRGKTVVFWIPLVIGVVAAVIFWVALGTVVTSDPGLLNSYISGS